MRVFVSSVVSGFEAYRDAVSRAITTLGHGPVLTGAWFRCCCDTPGSVPGSGRGQRRCGGPSGHGLRG